MFDTAASAFVEQCDVLSRVAITRDGLISHINEAAGIVLGEGALAGSAFAGFLVEPDAVRFRAFLDTWPDEARLTMNVAAGSGLPRTLRWHLFTSETTALLFGYEPHDTTARLERELIALNNELAVALREQQRATTAAERIGLELAAALDDVQRSNWLIRRLQDLLPICMDCGRVKPADGDWQELAAFLKQNSLFLTHGYCPECERRQLNDTESL